MNRRQLLKLLVSGVAGLVVDAELDLDRLLWVPNTKKIFLPTKSGLTVSQIIEIEYNRIIPKLHMLFERDDTFYTTLQRTSVPVTSDRAMRIPLILGEKNESN